jgi:uncharacterized membrane protein YhaH (DUF805 family)
MQEFFGYFTDPIKNHYVDFNGRERRKVFGFFVLITFIIDIILLTIGAIIGFQVLYYLFNLAILLPYLAISVRRLHDIGKSGWFALLFLIPIVSLVLLIILLAVDSVKGSNQYGENPKGE